MTAFNSTEASRLMRERRSIYPNMYSAEPVDDAIIHEMLENANWAPTHRLTEPWRFVVFKGKGLQKLAAFQSELYRKLSDTNGTFDEVKFRKLAQKPLLASHIIAIAMKRDPKKSLPEVEEIASVACAVQNMYLTATAHNIGCYWGSGGITYEEEAKPFFGLSRDDRLLGFLYIGHPKSQQRPPGKRNTIMDKVTWVTH